MQSFYIKMTYSNTWDLLIQFYSHIKLASMMIFNKPLIKIRQAQNIIIVNNFICVVNYQSISLKILFPLNVRFRSFMSKGWRHRSYTLHPSRSTKIPAIICMQRIKFNPPPPVSPPFIELNLIDNFWQLFLVSVKMYVLFCLLYGKYV